MEDNSPWWISRDFTYTDKNLTTGNTYYYKVRGYKYVNGRPIYGNYSDVISAKTALSKPVATAKKSSYKSIDLTWANNFIDALKPSQYKFKDNRYGKTHTGFIAQDVEEAMLSLGMKRTDFAGLVKSRKHSETPSGISTVEELNYDPDNFEGADENYDYSLRYDDFIAPLVAYCQNLKKKNTELENKLNKIYEKLGLSD